MNHLLAIKQTEDQIKSNEMTSHLFVMSILNMDSSLLKTLLMEHGRYLGCKKYWETLHYFRMLFDKASSKNVSVGLKKGISLDYYPGAEYYEFRYRFLSDDCAYEDEYEQYLADNDPNNTEFVRRFVLTYENGKIKDIRIPTKIWEGNVYLKYQQQN